MCQKCLSEHARNLGASQRQIFFRVALPSAQPAIYAGLILGASLSLIMLVYAEMTAANSGVGYYMYNAVSIFKTEEAFAGVGILAMLGFASGTNPSSGCSVASVPGKRDIGS